MKGYKAFKKGWRCRDFQYELGETYELPEGQTMKICECGFHFCANPIDVYGYYPMNDNTVIAEVEALGDIEQEGTKFVTNKIRIIKEFTQKQLQAMILDGHCNSGDYNSGDCNSGIFNTNEPKMRAFNRECDITYTEFLRSIDYSFWELCERISRKKLVDGDIELIKALPNFNAEIFKEITGVEI